MMHPYIENIFREHKFPNYYRNIFERVDFPFIDEMINNVHDAYDITNKNNVARFLFNVLSLIKNDDIICEEHFEEAYDFINNNSEIRIMSLPINMIIYDKFFRRGYSIEKYSSSHTYDIQKDKLLLYDFEIENDKLFYRFAVDKNGIVINYEYI